MLKSLPFKKIRAWFSINFCFGILLAVLVFFVQVVKHFFNMSDYQHDKCDEAGIANCYVYLET